MADFKPIETQEELDAIIGRTRKEATERAEKKYADYDSIKSANAELTEKLSAAEKTAKDTADKYKDYDQNLADLKNKVQKYEADSMKTRIALANGLPYEAAGRLHGETEEEIKADAELFAGLIKPKSQPMADPEPEITDKDSKRAAMRGMLRKMTGGNE